MRSIIFTLFTIGCSIVHLLAAPSLVGEWTTSFGRYSETVTYKADGTFASVTESERGPIQGTVNKSMGTWKLNNGELETTKKSKTFKTTIKFTAPTSFEEPSDFGQNGVLVRNLRVLQMMWEK